MSDAFKLEGFEELQKKLKMLPESVGVKVLKSALMSSTLPVLKEARNIIPKGDKAHTTYKGRLVSPGFASRNLVRRSKIYKNRQGAWVAIGVKKEAFYAVNFLELGTSKMPKQPWLSKAFENKKDESLKKFKLILKKRIEKVART